MAVNIYVKGKAVKLSDNFKSTEFDCHGVNCCSETLIDEKLVKFVQQIRNHFGKAVHVNSGYRCKTHNAKVGGASKSNHMDGEAADIRIDGVKPIEIAKYAESIGVLGIGVYSWGVHIDTRTTKYFWYDGGESNVKTFGAVKENTSVIIDTSKVVDKAADPKVIWDFLKSKGLNDYGIAGLMGNLQAESGLKPTNLQNTYEKKIGYKDAEYTAAVDQGIYTNFAKDSAGYGLAQWTYSTRKQALLDFCQKRKKSIGDLNAQLEFLMQELTTSYNTSVLSVLKKATSVLEASNAVLLKFEKPADQSATVQKKRAELGQAYYNKYHVEEKTETPKLPSEGKNGQMKYSSTNKPLVCMQTQSTCYKGTSPMTVKGVLWHSTGANNPNLKRYVQPSDNAADKAAMLKLLGTNTNKNDWNHIDRQAGLNCWIGKLADGTVTTVQTMPWDYKPWGCGSGAKGSCNNGWIQFEICEDGLTDKTYFDKVYKEACEITAYLCTMYNIDPLGTVTVNGVKVPTILCHADAHKLGFGSNHGDVNHWFPKFDKSMETARNDVAELMGKKAIVEKPAEKPSTTAELYRVRTSWEDASSQLGAFTNLDNAKKACDKVKGYYVFDSKGNAIYPEEDKGAFKIGDEVSIVRGASYTSGAKIADWVFQKKLYIRDFRDNGNSVVVSTLRSGSITGVVKITDIVRYGEPQIKENFKTYPVIVTADVLNVRAGAGTSYRVNTQIRKNEVYTIVDEKDNWGRLEIGSGWICLNYVRKLIK